MLFFDSLGEIPSGFGPSVVTIGKFDGVHTGHRRIIEELRAIAAERDLISTVLTFDRHPLSLLDPARCPISLLSNQQKRELLAELGVEATVMIAFDRELSRLPPEQFVQSILVDALHARVVLVGPDFRFGRAGSGDLSLLTALGERHGFEVRAIEAVMPDGQRSVSSTWIRQLLAKGEVEAAAGLLGREPSVRATVVRGAQRGRQLGYPTANLSPDVEGFIPADGVYAAWLRINGHGVDGRGVDKHGAGEHGVDGRAFPAAVSVGNNPTFEGVPDKQIEAYVLDEERDLYGAIVEVSFVECIRGMRKFPGAAELAAQMTLDERQIREILGTRRSA
ncbi:MAG: bifunctional riboflavin kinase/FAD synthetase [Lacisediminihabitans sp.]